MAQLKNKFLAGIQFDTDEQGRLKIYSDEQMQQFQSQREAIQKIERANQLKLEIQTETNNLLAQYAKEKQGFETKAKIGKVAQFVADPRMWAKGVWEVGKMVTENPRDVFIGAPRGALQSKEATKLYEQSAALNNEATRLAQTDKAKSEELLRQSQELYKTAQEKYGKAVGNLGELTTGKQIAAKSALAGLDIGSFLPVGGAIKGGVAATQVATKVPAAIQTTKLTGRANLISNALGLGDIYQGTQVAIKQGLGEATEQTLRGQAARAAIQGPVYGTLEVLADEEQEDTLGNIVKSSFINGITASGLTLGFGWAGRALVSKVAPKAGTMPTPTPTAAKPQLLLPDPTRVYEGQVITPPDTRILPPDIDPTSLSLDEIKKRSLGLGVGEKLEPTTAQSLSSTNFTNKILNINQDPIKQSLGAFDPETTIPMLDLTKTVKGNNIDFNPDSALSVNSARKVVDDIALLNGMQVGGKSLQIDKNDPKYQEVYNTQIKPLIDKINAVDEVAPVSEVSAQQIVEVQSQLDNLKATEQEVAIELNQDEMQLEALLDELKTHPGKTLHKYANKKEGKLPEITGKGSKYARQGDSIMTELGFTSDDEAQDAYQSWLGLIRQRDSLKANIKESSTFLKDITKEQQTLQKQLEETQPPIESYEQPQINKIPTEVKGEVSFQDLDEVKIKLPTGDKTYKLQYKATDAQKELLSKLEKEKNVVFKLQTEWEKEYKKIDKNALDDIQRKITDLEEKDTSPEALAYKKIVSETEFLDPKRNAAYKKLSNKPEYKVLWDKYKNIKKRYNEIYQEWENKSAELKKLAKQYFDTNPPSSKETVTRSEGIYGEEYEDPIDFGDWYYKYSEPTNVPDVVFDIAPVSENLGDEFQPKYIPTEPGKAPSFKKWLEFQSGWVDYTKNPDLARYYSSFQTYDPELKPQEIKKVLKNWDTFDEDSIDGFEIDENEGIWWVEEKEFMMSEDDWGEYTISNYFDKKTDKEFGQLIGEKFDTREKAKARLKELLEFKLNNKTAWDKAKKKIGKENKNESLEGLRKQYEDDLDEIIANNEQLRTQIQVEAGQSQLQFNKIPAEEVELEVNKIYNTLENEGFNIVPEKVVDTPAIDAVDDKLAKGDQPTAQEMDASMKELADTTGDPEVIAGVKQELNTRKKESTYAKRVVSANPELDRNAIVQYDVANMAEAQKYADDLVANNFDKAKEIAESIDASKIVDPRQVKVTETYTAKLLELGRYDEASDITANLSRVLTKEGQSIASVRNSNIADPVAVIRKLNNERQTRFTKEIQTEVAKVKEQLNNVVIDKNAIIEILDNITCR